MKPILRILFMLCISTYSYGQTIDYSSMPVAVQQKMDQNKAEGKDVLSDVNLVLELSIDRCKTEDMAIETLSLVKNEIPIIAIKFIDASHLQVVIPATFTATHLKEALTKSDVIVYDLFNEYFSVSK